MVVENFAVAMGPGVYCKTFWTVEATRERDVYRAHFGVGTVDGSFS